MSRKASDITAFLPPSSGLRLPVKVSTQGGGGLPGMPPDSRLVAKQEMKISEQVEEEISEKEGRSHLESPVW